MKNKKPFFWVCKGNVSDDIVKSDRILVVNIYYKVEWVLVESRNKIFGKKQGVEFYELIPLLMIMDYKCYMFCKKFLSNIVVERELKKTLL